MIQSLVCQIAAELCTLKMQSAWKMREHIAAGSHRHNQGETVDAQSKNTHPAASVDGVAVVKLFGHRHSSNSCIMLAGIMALWWSKAALTKRAEK